VNDPRSVRPIQRVGDVDPVPQNLIERQRSSRQSLRQRLTLQVLHDEILGLPFTPHVVHRANVWMRKLRDRLRFPLEPLARMLRSGELGRQHLHSHRPLEPRVARPVHFAHPTSAQRREDLVGAEPGPDRKCHRVRKEDSMPRRPRGLSPSALSFRPAAEPSRILDGSLRAMA
jgi:hypothetical protein